MAFLAPLVPYALPALGSAAASLGIGFGADKAWGDKDYTLKEGALDAGTGMLGLGVGKMLGMGLSKGVPLLSKVPGGTLAGYGLKSTRFLPELTAAGTIAGRHGFGEKGASALGPVGPGMPGMSGGVPQGPGLGHYGDYWTGGGINEAPDIYGGLGAPPTFNKTLEDYLKDPTLNRLASQEIIKMNAPLMRANKARHNEMVRGVDANEDAGRNVGDQIAQIRRENVQQVNDINDNAETSSQRVVQEADALAEDVGASIVSDDKTRQDLQAQAGQHRQEVADRQAADLKLLQRMAGAGQNALAELGAAEAMQTRSNDESIRYAAREDIRNNSEQVRQNWHERSGILGSLADTSLQRDMQAHSMGLQAWGQRLDALNSYRQNALEQQKMQAGTGMDPAMLSALTSLAMKPAGPQYSQTLGDGMEVSYQPQLWESNPMLAQALGGMVGQQNLYSTPLPQQLQEALRGPQ